MKFKLKNAIKEYQCVGCMGDGNLICFENAKTGAGCGKHYAGTLISYIGKIFLGMPKGFNRLGVYDEIKPYIFEKFGDYENYDMWNIPVWKHLSKDGHTFVRGIMPRLNEPFIHIFLEDCMENINCKEITQEDIDNMD